MSIRPYTGEYLVNPVAVHLGLNYCSHNCFYCYANLNNPDRRADYNKIKNVAMAIANKKQLKNLAVNLLQAGHPIMVSNDSDPFAQSNYSQFSSIFDMFNDLGIRFCFQTRGGQNAKKILAKSKPTMVYISFTSDNNEIIKKAEAGAPSFEARKDLALTAKALGHHVVIGLNPYQPEWWNDIYGFVDWLSANSFKHIWFGVMHLSHLQKPKIKAKQQEQFADVITKASKKLKITDETQLLLSEMAKRGINVFHGATSEQGGFWDAYFDLDFPFFPTLDDFFTALRQDGEENGIMLGSANCLMMEQGNFGFAQAGANVLAGEAMDKKYALMMELGAKLATQSHIKTATQASQDNANQNSIASMCVANLNEVINDVLALVCIKSM